MYDSRLQALEAENAALRRALATHTPPAAEVAVPAPSLYNWRDATLATLFSALPDYIYVVKRGTMQLPFCNDLFARSIGFGSCHDVEGRTIFECFPPAVAARFAAQNEIVFSTGQTLHEVERVDLPDSTHHFDTYKIPIRDAQGTIIGLVGTSRDITDLITTREALTRLNDELEERVVARTIQLLATNQRLEGEVAVRRAAEAELREQTQRLARSEERFRSLSTCSPVGIFLADTQGRYTYANPRLQQIFGLDAAALLADGFTRVLHPEDSAWVIEGWRVSVQLGREHQNEYRLLLADGTLRWVRGRTAPMRTEDGTVIGYVGTIEDISEQKRVDAALVQSQKLEGIGRLAGGVAHDFNNLLVVIAGCTHLAQDALPSNHPLQTDLTEIQRAAERATKLTRQLLTFARRQPTDLQVLNLNELLRDTGSLLRRLIRADIELVLHMEPNLWPLLADAGQIEQVIVNLAVNAYDAMPDGGTLTMETSNAVLDAAYCRVHSELTPGLYVMLVVSDTGTGMSAEVQALAFEPFFTTKDVGKGTGLGLATIYGIVKRHQGSISLVSELGVGTTLKIYLPRTERANTTEHSGRASDRAPRGSETVLLVEDEPSVRVLAARVLRSHGYHVVEASNGDEALNCAASMPPIDLLLTDMIMPGMGGAALAQQLSQRHAVRRVLFMSGYTDTILVAHSDATAADNFLQKPFLPTTLIRKVRAVLDAP